MHNCSTTTPPHSVPNAVFSMIPFPDTHLLHPCQTPSDIIPCPSQKSIAEEQKIDFITSYRGFCPLRLSSPMHLREGLNQAGLVICLHIISPNCPSHVLICVLICVFMLLNRLGRAQYGDPITDCMLQGMIQTSMTVRVAIRTAFARLSSFRGALRYLSNSPQKREAAERRLATSWLPSLFQARCS